MATKKLGRPTLLDEDRLNRITEALENGTAARHAIRAAGVTHTTYYNWLERGRKERDRRNANLPEDPTETPFLDFLDAVEKAEAVAATSHMQNIAQTALNGTWQASAWILERRFPRDYGRFDRNEVSGPDGGPVKVDVSTEELERKVQRILEQRGKE